MTKKQSRRNLLAVVVALLLGVAASLPVFAREQPRHHAGERKTFKIPGRHPHPDAARPPTGLGVVGRDALGQPLAPRGSVQPGSVTPSGHSLSPQPSWPGIGPASVATGSAVARQVPVPRAITPLASTNRGMIGGPSLSRRGTTLSVLGGRSVPTGGINGTTFSPRR